jgi:hypothetical protein
VVQALFHIPQVRAAVGQLRLPDLRGDVALNHPARAVWNLIELFTNLDLADLSAIADPYCVPSLENPEDRERMAENYADRARCKSFRSATMPALAERAFTKYLWTRLAQYLTHTCLHSRMMTTPCRSLKLPGSTHY